MPCLACRSSVTGLALMSARRLDDPTSDAAVNLSFNLDGFVPKGFLSPRLCMLCGALFCPPIPHLPVDLMEDGLAGARTGRAARTFPSFEDYRKVVEEGAKPEPERVVVAFKPDTAFRLMLELDERCRKVRGSLDDRAMAEAFELLKSACEVWKRGQKEEEKR